MRASIAAAAAVFLSLPIIASAQIADTTPPTVGSFDFNPKSIDVTGAAQIIDIAATVTDDLSGPASMRVRFQSPTSTQSHDIFLSRVDTGPLASTFTGSIEIPQFVESGTWGVFVTLWDFTSNVVTLSPSNLEALGFPFSLVVASNADLTPPTVTDVTPAPVAVDVSASDAAIELDFAITDDISGFDFSGNENYYWALLRSPSGGQYYAVPHQHFMQLSGDALDGNWRLSWTMPRFSEPGTWTVDFWVTDNAANFGNRPAVASFDVAATVADTTPPTVTNVTFSPALIDTSIGFANVTITMEVTDDLSGVRFDQASPFGGYSHGLFFRSPSTSQTHFGCCFTLVSGTEFDGTWEGTVFFPQYSEDGNWSAQAVGITDRTNNFLSLQPEELEAAGFAHELIVVRPSLEGDGQIGNGGGTVSDDSFPDRAQITFPAGMLGGDTNVAIDVFPDPLAVPTPAGFQGPGTFFVNVDLSPEPTYPLPAPGATVTLPLVDFVNPGTSIPLYFVDPVSGLLVPMPSTIFGATNVVGTVNADGLSVTFTGVSHFSILVGLLPDTIEVAIDVLPGSSKNLINAQSRASLPIAVLSSESFDALTQVDIGSLTFGQTGDEDSLRFCGSFALDVNRDRLKDLVCLFHVPSTGLEPGDELAILKGQTVDGTALIGSDAVTVHSRRGGWRHGRRHTWFPPHWEQRVRHALKCAAQAEQRGERPMRGFGHPHGWHTCEAD